MLAQAPSSPDADAAPAPAPLGEVDPERTTSAAERRPRFAGSTGRCGASDAVADNGAAAPGAPVDAVGPEVVIVVAPPADDAGGGAPEPPIDVCELKADEPGAAELPADAELPNAAEAYVVGGCV